MLPTCCPLRVEPLAKAPEYLGNLGGGSIQNVISNEIVDGYFSVVSVASASVSVEVVKVVDGVDRIVEFNVGIVDEFLVVSVV